MPYIPLKSRGRFSLGLSFLLGAMLELSPEAQYGAVNFLILRLVEMVFQPKTYVEHQNVVGLLECVKQEYVRRRLAPYEDRKCAENGDIYEA